jgi:hypothetical protein
VSNAVPNDMRPLLNRTYCVMLMAAGVDYAIADPLDEELKEFIRIVNERDDSTTLGKLLLTLYDKTVGMEKLTADDVNLDDPEQRDVFKTVQVLYNDIIYTDSYLRV